MRPTADDACATTILSRIARLAYRRPVTAGRPADAARVLRERPARRRQLRRRHSVRARADAGRSGLPAARPPGSAGAIRGAAAGGPPPERPRARLAPVVLPVEQHSRRAPARPGRARRAVQAGRSSNSRCGACWPIRARRRALVDDFAAQWLNLRRVGEVVVHPDVYPGLRRQPARGVQAGDRAVRRQHAARGSQRRRICCAPTTRSSTNGWRATTAFPGIYGSRFRRVTLPNPDQRGGLLAHGALLATTSYPDRTSPVLRGKWLLDNIFGVAVPPPPPDVDTTLPETKPGTVPPTIRERLAQHRTQSGVRQLPLGDRSARVSRSRISTRSAAGGRSTNRAGRSTRPGRP